MKRQAILISVIVFYAVGILAAILVLATGSKQYEKSRDELPNSLSSFTKMNKNENTIGLIEIDQPIAFSPKGKSFLAYQETGASYWLEQMNYAATNENIKAVIIKVNSPGGTVGASQELHAAVKRIQEAGKPVVTSIADLSASGGYYATVSSDRIFSNPGSLVGSIGVILGGIEYSELLIKLGIKYQAITSGVNKDILSPYKKMTEKQKEFLQIMVNSTYEQFLVAVAQGRKKSKETIRPLADGSVYTGSQAVENGLVDQLGTFYDAIVYTKVTYNLSNANVELITPKNSSFNIKNLISILAPSTPQVNIIETSPPLGYSPVLYLYQF